MREYLKLVEFILKNGEKKEDRTGTGTISIFGWQSKYNLADGFPLVTTKKTHFNGIVRELLWFIAGKTNINDGLLPYTKIWNDWADENGELGPIYGYQWRNWEKFTPNKKSGNYDKSHIDQLTEVIKMIKSNPNSRRLIVNAWNVADLDRMALPPCHMFFQFYVVNGRLDCQLYQRSADVALGVPFNIASYSLLLTMMAQECNLKPGYFIHTFGDAHIYLNHIEGLKLQLSKEPLPLAEIKVAKKPFFDIKFEDIELINYQSHETIKFPIAV